MTSELLFSLTLFSLHTAPSVRYPDDEITANQTEIREKKSGRRINYIGKGKNSRTRIYAEHMTTTCKRSDGYLVRTRPSLTGEAARIPSQ